MNQGLECRNLAVRVDLTTNQAPVLLVGPVLRKMGDYHFPQSAHSLETNRSTTAIQRILYE